MPSECVLRDDNRLKLFTTLNAIFVEYFSFIDGRLSEKIHLKEFITDIHNF